MIFERGKFFTFEIQVIHQANVTPDLLPIGKIAGLENQKIMRLTTPESSPQFWVLVFSGPISVQIIRILIYFVGSILLLVGFIALAVGISNARDNARAAFRRKGLQAHLAQIMNSRNENERELIERLSY